MENRTTTQNIIFAEYLNSDGKDESGLPLVERKAHTIWEPDLPIPKGISLRKYKVSISKSTDIECFYYEAKKSKKTLFYIPGTASATIYYKATNMVCAYLAKSLNCNVIVIFHRNSINNKYPKPMKDVKKTIKAHLTANPPVKIDQNQLYIGGYSSGGSLLVNIAIQTCLQWQGDMPF